MKLCISYIHRTSLYTAVEKGKIEIAQLLLNKEQIDINIQYVLIFNKFIQFH